MWRRPVFVTMDCSVVLFIAKASNVIKNLKNGNKLSPKYCK